jgi:hypothetical protein
MRKIVKKANKIRSLFLCENLAKQVQSLVPYRNHILYGNNAGATGSYERLVGQADRSHLSVSPEGTRIEPRPLGDTL